MCKSKKMRYIAWEELSQKISIKNRVDFFYRLKDIQETSVSHFALRMRFILRILSPLLFCFVSDAIAHKV